MLWQELNGSTFLYSPHYGVDRAAWLPISYDEERLATLAIESVELFGEKIAGYATGPFYTKESLSNLCVQLDLVCKQGNFVFMPMDDSSVEVKVFTEQLLKYVPALVDHIIDISPLIAQLRQKKVSKNLNICIML